jgi:6-pyruvoyl-tetrahydropterin synthase
MARLFVDRLTVLDFSYLHPERGLLGESWLLDIELEGSLDHQGMVLDFSKVKAQVKRTVDQDFDHKLLVPARYPELEINRNAPRCDLRFRLTSGEEISHSAPVDATCLLDAEAVTPDTLAMAIMARLRPGLPDNVTQIQIRLRNEAPRGTYYQVSHGLKHHAGNCQRIAHGHRSNLEILRDGKPDPELEAEWAARWRDIYIGTREDLQGEATRNGIGYYRFSYTSEQGLFELALPQDRCYLIDSDSTVENLAQHIADSLKQRYPDARFRVRAYEGVEKGAIAEA